MVNHLTTFNSHHRKHSYVDARHVHSKMKSILLMPLFFCSVLRISGETNKDTPENALQVAVSSIQKLNETDEEHLNRIRYIATYGGSNVNLSALIHLWFLGDTPQVELSWWKSNNRNLRTIIISLYICDRSEPVEGILNFKQICARFEIGEKKQRLEELNYAINHKKAIASILTRFLKEKATRETLTESQEALLKNYENEAR